MKYLLSFLLVCVPCLANTLPIQNQVAFFTQQLPTSGGGADITTGLVDWWKFDEGSGSTAADSGSAGNNGTLVNSPTWTTGHINGALAFASSSSQKVTASTGSTLGGLTKVSIAAWLNRSSVLNVAFGAGAVSQFDRFNIIWYLDGNIYAQYGNNDSGAYAYCALAGTGWHHVALVFDGTLSGNARILFYVDGVAKTMTYASTPPTALSSSVNLGGFLIGQEIANGYSDGIIDDVRVYNRVLAPADVAALASM